MPTDCIQFPQTSRVSKQHHEFSRSLRAFNASRYQQLRNRKNRPVILSGTLVPVTLHSHVSSRSSPGADTIDCCCTARSIGVRRARAIFTFQRALGASYGRDSSPRISCFQSISRDRVSLRPVQSRRAAPPINRFHSRPVPFPRLRFHAAPRRSQLARVINPPRRWNNRRPRFTCPLVSRPVTRAGQKERATLRTRRKRGLRETQPTGDSFLAARVR